MKNHLQHWAHQETRWSKLRLYGNSTIAKATIAIPILGYFILFNYYILDFLKLHTSFCSGAGCEASWRLYFIYFGCCAIAIGSALYGWKCPTLIKKYGGAAEFFEAEKAYFSQPNNLAYLFSLITIEKRSHPTDPLNLKSSIIDRQAGVGLEQINMLAGPMGEHYVLQNFRHPVVRLITFLGYVCGTVLLLVPTVYTFFQVLLRALHLGTTA